MSIKVKTYEYDVKNDVGSIVGYASTWIREPDSWGDIVAKGAFAESIAKIKAENKTIPLLWGHQSEDLSSYIGTVTNLEEDDHGLKFEAVFDDTPEAQRARELAMDGRLAKFSFAYDVLDQAIVDLEDGTQANELRKLDIHEVSLVFYPANRDTSVVSVKSGRRNRKTDEDIIKQIISLAQSLLADEGDDTDDADQDSDAKSKELKTANDEERKRLEKLIKKAEDILS